MLVAVDSRKNGNSTNLEWKLGAVRVSWRLSQSRLLARSRAVALHTLSFVSLCCSKHTAPFSERVSEVGLPWSLETRRRWRRSRTTEGLVREDLESQ